MLNYNKTLPDGASGWVVTEERFSNLALAKCEAVMALGNGYMGLRSAAEESYVGEKRNLFVNGTFNRFDELEVSELPNAADVTRMDIRIDGKCFSLDQGEVKAYSRSLNLREAELVRTFIWNSGDGKELEFTFRRFVSLDQLHLIGLKLEVKVLRGPVHLSVASGIDAQVSNSGSQHFHEGEKRIYDKTFLELIQTTTESKVDFVIGASHKLKVDGGTVDLAPAMEIDRRKVAVAYSLNLEEGQTLTLDKVAAVYTSRDKQFAGNYSLPAMRAEVLDVLKTAHESGYETLFSKHAAAWAKVWENYGITIESGNPFDLLGVRFALYHLVAMTPAHDNRMGIGAKGLSGEGYKGHSFWDTEIFILPFYIYSNPQIARSLLEYRYLGLEGARSKAKENGYAGAMYPWEAAWPSDGEVTPVWGAVDIVTGEQTKIWSGFIEQHITSDIAYAVWHYFRATGDVDFMEDYGYEIIFDTAVFWASRLEWNEAQGRYEINEVVGPDEYKEHVDNNAFTNYMAHFNIELAMQYYKELEQNQPELFARYNKLLNLHEAYGIWESKLDLIYLPQPNERLIIPQDDTYLQKEIIDLTPYKDQEKVGSIFNDYNLDQVGNMQISKQADIMMLFFLLENKFSPEVKRANYDYYEEKTLHDSSLSLSTHSILASDFGDKTLAYRLFQRATEIDLGPKVHSSDAGIHAASLGGIWECAVMGFAGVRMLDGQLHLAPKLPEHWDKLAFPLYWQGQRLEISITPQEISICSTAGQPVSLFVHGQLQEVQSTAIFANL
ncbi:glycoside hydrolase family 65 protein [Paenibacillus riograndensis]|uniref:Sugar hydrolase/phosphorylase n=1 Tax=Paenibacillus riograndensis SBR5 TaxID=1073571 RepID=A0A0E4CVF8_9BACL|nr:glycosyl hydrolase family 65 protein [Paenibacillus riograndensis]CQR54097.1 Sugar hydrolase/phosphorylase [Paenibacillus riograndensis SBR5]